MNKLRSLFNTTTRTGDTFLLGLWTSAFLYEFFVFHNLFASVFCAFLMYLHYKDIKDDL